MTKPWSKQYIGDGTLHSRNPVGVYVEFDGYGIVLTTENGVSVTNRIVLESEMLASLFAYVTRLSEVQPTRDA